MPEPIAPTVPADYHFLSCRLVLLNFEVLQFKPLDGDYPMQFVSTHEVPGRVDESGTTLVSVSFGISVPNRSAEAGTTECPFRLEARIEGQFGFPAGFDAARRIAVLKTHAPALLYSQLRPVVRTVSAEAGQMLVLPLINVAATMAAAQPVAPE